MICGRKFKVEGRVQGVWFRESTRKQASKLKLTGRAVNMPDGSVEVVAFGDDAALDSLHQWLKSGPPLAKVTKVVEYPCDESATAQFTTA